MKIKSYNNDTMKFRINDNFFVYLIAFLFIATTTPRRDPLLVAAEEKRETPCLPALAASFPNEQIQRFENGSLLHEGFIYSPDWYWQDNNLTYGCVCEVRSNCVRKCCPEGQVLSDEPPHNCLKRNEIMVIPELSPGQDQLAEDIRNMSRIGDRFVVVSNRECHIAGSVSYKLEPENYEEDKFVLQSDGRLFASGQIFPHWKYCMDWNFDVKNITVVVCHEPSAEPITADATIYPVGIIISIPFLLATLIVYAIIPELKNLYGMTLMCYVACLIAAYFFLAGGRLIHIRHPLCSVIPFVIHFSFLASFFWLNVMCFDIWWTFGGFRSLQGSVKQRERKKFIIYSIYAWGSATVLTGICLIMDFVPSVPKNFIRPQFGVESCWFSTNTARAIYFYGPMGVTVICNICLFISTALKIIQHKKDTAHHLKGMDSRRHDDNKQWFNLYLKLFIVMGINWSMEIISWLCEETPEYVWYITDLANTLQGVIIFIIFVWKDKIKRLLLKRLGCQNRSFQSRNSTRSAYHSSASRTCTTTAVMAPLHEKANPYVERAKTTTDESDCV